MTVNGMFVCFCRSIALMIMSLMISVIKWTIGGNWAIKDFGMVMMRCQVVTQEY